MFLMYKKILLSSAIAVALGTSGFAQAAVDLNKPSGENPLVFAQEIAIGSGIVLNVTAAGIAGGGTSAANVAVTVDFGFTIGQGTSKYVRLTFDEALTAALATTAFSDTSTSSATTPASTVDASPASPSPTVRRGRPSSARSPPPDCSPRPGRRPK
jgi:dihydrodipicolinate reductase